MKLATIKEHLEKIVGVEDKDWRVENYQKTTRGAIISLYLRRGNCFVHSGRGLIVDRFDLSELYFDAIDDD